MRRSPAAATARAARPGRALAVDVLLVVAATVAYFLVPLPGRMRETSWAVLFSCGTAVLGLLIVLAIRRLLGAGERVRVRALVLLLVLTVLWFAWCDDSVARLPGQFADLSTRTDGVYFTVSTLATVGFGDVHPAGQLARAAVTVQMVFNLVFLGAAVAVISGFVRTRARSRMGGPGVGRGGDGESPVPDGRDGAA